MCVCLRVCVGGVCACVFVCVCVVCILQDVRTACGFGFRVNSAYRCGEYNAKVSKNTRGQHSTGEAVDISMKDRYKRFQLLQKAMECGYFKDIALSGTFIHLGRGNVQNGIGVY